MDIRAKGIRANLNSCLKVIRGKNDVFVICNPRIAVGAVTGTVWVTRDGEDILLQGEQYVAGGGRRHPAVVVNLGSTPATIRLLKKRGDNR